MAKPSWEAVSGQFAKLAEQGRAERVKPEPAHEAKEAKPDEAVASQGHDAITLPMPIAARAEPVREPSNKVKKAEAAEPPAKAEKRSTSLYLSGGAMRALRTLAAQEGVRPHRVIDDALRAHFKRKGLDFDALNATD